MKPAFCAQILIFLMTTSSLAASELWITPAVDPPDIEVGDWAVTSSGETHFNFAIPDDFAALTGAKVVVIGKNDKKSGYELSLSIAQDAYYYDDLVAEYSGKATFARGELSEVDITSVFPADLEPGVDYIGLYFITNFARVLGLRFEYENADLGLLREDLEQETLDRAKNDTKLRTDLTAEQSARIAADQEEAALRESVDRAIRLDLTAEQSARIAADEAEADIRDSVDNILRNGLTLETTERQAGDFDLQTALNGEIDTRIGGDEALQSQIDTFSCPTCPTCPAYPEAKTFYLTSTEHQGDTVQDACTSDYHVANPDELVHVAEMEYAEGIGLSKFSALDATHWGWFRGFNNCSGFTTNEGIGTRLFMINDLHWPESSGIESVSLLFRAEWSSDNCDQFNSVWCVSD